MLCCVVLHCIILPCIVSYCIVSVIIQLLISYVQTHIWACNNISNTVSFGSGLRLFVLSENLSQCTYMYCVVFSFICFVHTSDGDGNEIPYKRCKTETKQGKTNSVPFSYVPSPFTGFVWNFVLPSPSPLSSPLLV